jgi:hypothetical protein
VAEKSDEKRPESMRTRTRESEWEKILWSDEKVTNTI